MVAMNDAAEFNMKNMEALGILWKLYMMRDETREKIMKEIEEIFRTSLTMVEPTSAALLNSFLPMNSEMYFVPAIGKAKGAITVKIV